MPKFVIVAKGLYPNGNIQFYRYVDLETKQVVDRPTPVTAIDPAYLSRIPVTNCQDNKTVLLEKYTEGYTAWRNNRIVKVTAKALQDTTKYVPVNYTTVSCNGTEYIRMRAGCTIEDCTTPKQKETIYMLHVHSVTDCADSDHILHFRSKTKAIKAYKQEVEAAKIDAGDDWCVETSENSYTTWEDGCFCENHIKIELQQVKFAD